MEEAELVRKYKMKPPRGMKLCLARAIDPVPPSYGVEVADLKNPERNGRPFWRAYIDSREHPATLRIARVSFPGIHTPGPLRWRHLTRFVVRHNHVTHWIEGLMLLRGVWEENTEEKADGVVLKSLDFLDNSRLEMGLFRPWRSHQAYGIRRLCNNRLHSAMYWTRNEAEAHFGFLEHAIGCLDEILTSGRMRVGTRAEMMEERLLHGPRDDTDTTD